MIPKIFHHIWVGPNPVPEKTQQFIDGAKRLHPDFEFRFWNEANLNLDNEFCQSALQKKAWAFISDYHRIKILYDMGGIYLDTDMEVLRSFAPLLNCEGFAGLNRQEDTIYCGVIGARPKLPLMKSLHGDYIALGGEMPTSPPQMLTRAYQLTQPENFHIFPPDYFYPVEQGENRLPPTTSYATHHWDESWRKWVPLRRFLRRTGVMRLYHATQTKAENISRYIDVKKR